MNEIEILNREMKTLMNNSSLKSQNLDVSLIRECWNGKEQRVTFYYQVKLIIKVLACELCGSTYYYDRV